MNKPTDQQLIDLYESWDEMVKLKERMGKSLLELIAHPEATNEQIVETALRYRKVVYDLRKHKPNVLEALNKGYSYKLRTLADALMNTRL